MRMRIRGPSGVKNVSLSEDAMVVELRSLIAESSGVPAYDLKIGYPPQPLNLEEFEPTMFLKDTGLKLNGEQLLVAPRSINEQLSHPLQNTTPSAAAPLPGSQTHAANQASELQQPLGLSRKANNVEREPPVLRVPSEGKSMVLRVMPDDNSCLFRAVGTAVLGDSLDAMRELRSMVAEAIYNLAREQPDLYNEATLERSPEDYSRWIQRDDAWGGSIELGIFANHFKVEICSIDVQHLRVDRYNQGMPRRIIVVYSGIHYDTIALTPSPSDPVVKATFQFDSSNDEVLERAVKLCSILQERRYYTDTGNLGVKCNICGWTGNGEMAAVQHATATSHHDFGEVD
ncbi:ubiquitin thioesterase OTU1 [Phyllosticta citrichinensis]|uniref:Ubiquitin thioesterase OTU n=1 Tax=Phyllosticta citrichinensis TaxID=1130410 RepID=A0ABR1Y1C5_9PEZI